MSVSECAYQDLKAKAGELDFLDLLIHWIGAKP